MVTALSVASCERDSNPSPSSTVDAQEQKNLMDSPPSRKNDHQDPERRPIDLDQPTIWFELKSRPSENLSGKVRYFADEIQVDADWNRIYLIGRARWLYDDNLLIDGYDDEDSRMTLDRTTLQVITTEGDFVQSSLLR